MIPNDPFMLLSFVNMKLRDSYETLERLCDDLDVSKDEIIDKLSAAGFEYSIEQNKFW